MTLTIQEALKVIYQNVKKTSTITIPIENALGSVLAQDVIATHNLPPYDNSAMDGYAIRLQDAGMCVKSTHTILAGDNTDVKLQDGEVIKIMTGAKLPDGTQAIVPIENTSACKDGVLLPDNIKEAQHMRYRGEDIKKGDLLLEDGVKLQAHDITILASQGISHIKVYKKPRVALFGSGSELKMHYEKVESYQLYNTNTPTFAARLQELGCEVEFLGMVKDDLDSIKQCIKSALDADFIITSGGVSVGEADWTKEAFLSFGYEIFFDKVQIKPGKPTTFGKIKDTFVLNLPGNPLAAALNFELFGKAIVLSLSANKAKYQQTIKAKLLNDYKIKTNRSTLIPGYFDGEFFTPHNNFAPGMVRVLSQSNGFIILDGGINGIKKDDIVRFIPTRFDFYTTKQTKIIT